MLGWAESTRGDVAAAMRHFEQNAAAYRRIGDRIGEAAELANLGDLAMELNDTRAAGQYLVAALSVQGVTEDRYLAPSLVRSVATWCALSGRSQDAVVLHGASASLYARFGLTPDPGDEVSERLAEEARASSLDPQADAERGATMSLEQAIAACLACLPARQD
jgi:hypothetical protein